MSEEICKEELELREELKRKRDVLGLTNQDIADSSGLSIHAVVNFFSARSKAPSYQTMGRICRTLGVSLDQAFGIAPDKAEEPEATQRIHELELENTRQDGEIGRLTAVQELQTEQVASTRMTHIFLVGLCLMLTAALAAYIVIDATDSLHGFIRDGAPSPVAFIMFGVLIVSVMVIGWSVVRYIRGK